MLFISGNNQVFFFFLIYSLLNVIMTQSPPAESNESQENGNLEQDAKNVKVMDQSQQDNGNLEQEQVHKYNSQNWDRAADPLEAMHWFDIHRNHHIFR